MGDGNEAHPPPPPTRGGVDDHGDVVLTSADGTEFAAYYAHPNYPARSSIVILPDVRGLHSFYKELAVHFADVGFHALAFDYFGRTAGTIDRGEDFAFREHLDRLDAKQVDADTAAAVTWLRALPDGGNCPVFSIGFCFGGSLSWRQSAAGHGLRGCIGFYGSPTSLEDRIEKMASPLLLLVAGKDETPIERVEQFAERVRQAGVSAEVRVYPDAPRSFFDRSFEQFEDECDDAWYRILAFTERYA